MKLDIRRETSNDYKKVEEITREAFWNLYFPGCEEHYVVHKIRNHKDYIKELSFIIEVDGEIAGSIFYTHSKIVQKDASEINTITFGPVSIHPKWHRQGYGNKLIRYSIEEAKKLGYKAILILGYPYHYEPYGFVGARKFNIAMADGKYYVGLQALQLLEDGLAGISGYADFSDVFEVDRQEVDRFDKTFSKKIKEVKDCQKQYEKYATMIDE